MNLSGACSAFGDPQAPPILFLHGIRLGREIWAPHARSLARRYRIVTLDLPGHGTMANVPFTLENVTSLIDHAIDEVLAAPPLIVGYSLGGYVAMRYAARFPERTRGLLLTGCTLDLEGWRWWPYGASVWLTELLPDPLLSAMIHAGLALSLPREWVSVVQAIPFDRTVFAQTSAIVRSSDHALDDVATYRKPVLFVNGEFDLVFRSDERRFLHRLPQARLRIIRGVDHTGPLRRIEEFTSIVEAFAAQVFEGTPTTKTL